MLREFAMATRRPDETKNVVSTARAPTDEAVSLDLCLSEMGIAELYPVQHLCPAGDSKKTPGTKILNLVDSLAKKRLKRHDMEVEVKKISRLCRAVPGYHCTHALATQSQLEATPQS